MPSVYIQTFGCQMNVRDSDQVAEQLQARGYTLTQEAGEADVILLNTCSVREQAEKRALDTMRQFESYKKKNPKLILGFLGCMAQRIGPELLEKLPKLDLVIGTQKFHEVARHLDEIRNSDEALRILDVEAEAGSQNTIKDQPVAPKQATAFVSIMQGCNMHCTFCIVPTTRGAERARPMREIVDEVRRLTDLGIKEVTLLGQIVNLYGRHEFPTVDGKTPFRQLLDQVCSVDGIERVRFTSPHPVGFKKDVVAAFAELPQLCQHVHLPLQSGSNRMLKAMHRAYTAERFIELADQLREARPDIAITSDLIVGFPGETREDFEATKHVMRRVRLDNAFIFRYSPRSGTPAAGLVDQLSDEEKMARNQELLTLQDELTDANNVGLVGSEVEILVEGESKNNPKRFQGRTRQNKLVMIEAEERWRGELLPVRITESTRFTHYAEPVLVNV
jgi:tRNA-2-methylthio-N6-dimethylallyladenosine synthase